ncbi:hypothetical protein [Marivivens donghaensis]|uniref:hypothetical protein n=1 Tax=Marivivens donghaensis TaxID=1699413 RepID=UPI00201ED762|nr:hypothetical protein [Marivivens donghaensis]MCL7409440.1 hypothetical protein [Marivivens donghaensis]MDN3702919.1 hypothetical protein [Marivivens donghaensis]
MKVDINGKIKDCLSTLDKEFGVNINCTYKREKNKRVTYGTLETMLKVEKIEEICERFSGMQVFPTCLPYNIHEIILTCPEGDIIQRLQFFPEPNEERIKFSGYKGECELIIAILQDQVAPDICSTQEALYYDLLCENI